MLTETMRRDFIPVLLLGLLVLLWPWSAGYLILLGCAVCVGAIWGAHASSAGKYFRGAGYATVPGTVEIRERKISEVIISCRLKPKHRAREGGNCVGKKW